jgi:hypothetical protein
MYEAYKINKAPWVVFAVIDTDTNDVLIFNEDSLLNPLFYRYRDDPEAAWLFLHMFKRVGEVVSWLEFLVFKGQGELGVRDIFEEKRRQADFKFESRDF